MESDGEKRWILPAFLMGHLPALTDFLETKPKPLRYINWYFRLFGAPIFLNNPISGLLVIVAAFVDNHYYATSGLIGGTLGFVTALLVMKDPSPLQGGGVAFNSFLVGLVLPRFVQAVPGDYNWKAMILIAVISVLCVYVSLALDNIFGKLQVPAFNLAFNICAIALLGATQGSQFLPGSAASSVPPIPYANLTGTGIGKGILLGVGQTLGFSSLASSGIILAAMFIFSPLLCLQAIIATCVGLSTGLAIGANVNDIYSGQYGYNAVLTCCALGGFFLVYGAHTQFLTILAGILTALVFTCLQMSLSKVGLGCVALPFVLVGMFFMGAAKEIRGVTMTAALSYPEQHLHDHIHNPVHPEKVTD